MYRVIKVLIFVFTFLPQIMAAFDWNYGMNSLWLCSASYCDPATYLTRTYQGNLTGFAPVYRINGSPYDVQGIIGYTASMKAIQVVFRGSSSIANWFANLDAISMRYPPCTNCYVHKGFYDAEQSVIANIITQVSALRSKYPTYQVIVTGHSLGAALATLAAVDIKNAGIPVRLFNYGSPRVGDNTFSAWVSSWLTDHSRVTHRKDAVVHQPVSGNIQHWTHIDGEYFEPTNEVILQNCYGYEDPKCCYQYNLATGNSIDDHMYYLGVNIGCRDV